MSYKGKSLSKKELANRYDISVKLLNKWMSEIAHKIEIGKRRILKPKEIDILVQEFGDWD